MTEFERITVSPAVLGSFLSFLPCLGGPWDDAFHREFCSKCTAENCDDCQHEAERNNPAWWLELIHTGTGPVRTEKPEPVPETGGGPPTGGHAPAGPFRPRYAGQGTGERGGLH